LNNSAVSWYNFKAMQKKIGIIGLGYVGGSVHYWFEHEFGGKTELFSYDKYKNIGSVKEINKAEIIFICVPTPFYEDGSGYDDSIIIESLEVLNGSKIVIIKSTVLPGSTEMFQKKFSHHKILFNPEFLVAKTAVRDFLKPSRQIIGYTNESKKYAQDVLDILPFAPFVRVIPATEAEMVKYFCNAFLSTKVIFANQIYDLCDKLNINYDAVKEAAAADSRIGASHLNIFDDGYRGYGGACFPKDMKSIIGFAEKIGVDLGLFKKVDEMNDNLTKPATKPSVSVIITTFNKPTYLKEAVVSALRQDFDNFEIIVIDDCSDGKETKEAVASFSDKRIKYIRNKENFGGAISLNIGLNAAKGKYIAVLDDDDAWIAKEKLSQQVKFLESNSDYVLVGTGTVVVDYSTDKEIVKSKAPYDDASIRKNFLLSNPIAHSSVLYRHDAVLKAGGYDKTLARGKDYDLLLKLGLLGKLAILPDYFVKYRESSLNKKNILATRAKDAGLEVKIVWCNRKNYPHAIRGLARVICRYVVFSLLRPFHRIIKPLYGIKRARTVRS